MRSRVALLLRFYSVFCVGADFGSLGLFGRIFGDFFRDFIAIVKNCVRETAVRVHIGAQNCGKNAIFQSRLDKYSVFRNSSACLCTWFFTVSLGFHSELCVSSTLLGFDIRLTDFLGFRGGRFQVDFPLKFVLKSKEKLVLVTPWPFWWSFGWFWKVCWVSKFAVSLRFHSAFSLLEGLLG